MTSKETVFPAARERVAAAALRENLAHGGRLQRLALARLQHLDARLAPFGAVRWKSFDPKDPRTLALLRHAARLHRARTQTAHAIALHHRSLALALPRVRAAQVEKGRVGRSVSPTPASDPSCMSTAEWMRWRAGNLRKRH